MWKYIVVWVVMKTVSVPCNPLQKQHFEPGVGCSIDVFDTLKSASLSKKEATDFYINAKREGKHVIKIDSIKSK